MKLNYQAQQLYDYATSFLGVPYKYGGRNRLTGMDCNWYLVELLKSEGIVPWNYIGWSSKTQKDLVNLNAERLKTPQFGACLFWSDDDTEDGVYHSAFALDQLSMYEAGGGTSTTITLDEAAARGAMVRRRPISMRREPFSILLPRYSWL